MMPYRDLVYTAFSVLRVGKLAQNSIKIGAPMMRLSRGIANNSFPDGSQKRRRPRKVSSNQEESDEQKPAGKSSAFSRSRTRPVLSIAQATNNLMKISQVISSKSHRQRYQSELEGLEVI
jgi:hypothetical protein